MRNSLPADDNLYFEGKIPARKLANAKNSHALAPQEEILVLYDNTFFGNGRSGLVVTASRLGLKRPLERAMSVELRLLAASELTIHPAWMKIKCMAVNVRSGPVRAGLLDALLKLLDG